MSEKSKIEWTEATWNPVTGCTPVSPGCRNCYARRWALRLQKMGGPKYRDGFEVRVHPEVLNEPFRWRKSRVVFVCSMGDLYHEKVPDSFIRNVYDVMRAGPPHVYLVLTKRPERVLRSVYGPLPWNMVLGVTVEERKHKKRIEWLQYFPGMRFVSLEPLLEPVGDLPLHHIDWVIVGGETGPGARPMPFDEPARIRDACLEAGVPFFFKRWGDFYRDRGRELEGRTWEQLPDWRRWRHDNDDARGVAGG